MKIFVNNRWLFFIFVSLFLGIFFAYPIVRGNWWSIFFIALIMIGLFIVLLKSKKLLLFLIYLSVFLAGIGLYFASVSLFDNENYDGQRVVVAGRVSFIDEGDNCLHLDNASVNGKNSRNIVVYVYDGDVQLGDTLVFESTLHKFKVSVLHEFNYYYKNINALHYCSANSEDWVKTHGDLTLSENIKEKVKTLIYSNMSAKEAEVAFACLFGDKSSMSQDVVEAYKGTGIAHLLAVSGLHIGVLTIFIMFLLKKTKMPPWLAVSITAILLFGYCALCSFSPSVLRASFMFIILCSAKLFGRRYDSLISIGAVGIFLLLADPLNVFNNGFVLSFVCVLALAFLTKPLTKLFQKWRFPKWLNNCLAPALAIQIGTFPIFVLYFGQVPSLSLLVNLICLPMFEITFICNVLMTSINLVLPLGFLFAVPAFGFKLILLIAQKMLSFSLPISVSLMTSLIAITYLSSCFSVHYIKFKNWQIKVACIVSALVIAVGLSIHKVVPIPKDDGLVFLNSGNTNVIMVQANNQRYTVTNGNLYILERYQENNNCKDIDANFLLTDEGEELDYATNIPLYEINEDLRYTNGNLEIGIMRLIARQNGLTITIGEFDIFVITTELTDAEELEFNLWYDYDMLILSEDEFNLENSNFDYIVSSEPVQNAIITNFVTDVNGNWTLTNFSANMSVRSLD